MSLWDFFSDPVLRAPTIASMWMCFSAGILGVLIFLRRRCLVGEVLSHASYPGVTIGILLATFLHGEGELGIWVLGGAFVSAILGFATLNFLQSKLKITVDSSLCLVLTTYFGVGVTLASRIQFTHTHAFRQIQSYLYGQAATMTDFHIGLYSTFSLVVILFIYLFYKELQTISFDKSFARSLGLQVKWIETLLFIFIVMAIVMGMRSVGVVLISGMIVAPAVAARQYTHRLSTLLTLAGSIGLICGFLGNYFSVILSTRLSEQFPDWRASLPTGPMIVLVAAAIAVLSILFAPQRGFFARFIRIGHFRMKRREENLLKALWRKTEKGEQEITPSQLIEKEGFSRTLLRLLLVYFQWKGWIKRSSNRSYALTKLGKARGGRIVRLHRLWEAYLVTYLGEGIERVHHSAEEMEHILTPELEKQLTELLSNPLQDPHAQPIPSQEEVMSNG